MLITAALRAKLLEHGVASQFPGNFQLPDNCVFEPPCSIKRMQVAFSLEMGAFSFAKSGYYFGVKIGRYTSIDDAVQIGRGSHPITWATTSPLYYMQHEQVFNQTLEAAEGFRPSAPPQRPNVTTIGHDVRIGYGALISQGVTIHNGAVIQPMAVVTKDVPPYAIVAGNPGVITGMRLPLMVAARMQALAWWRFAVWDMSGAPVGEPMKFCDHVKRQIDAGMKPYEPPQIVLKELAA